MSRHLDADHEFHRRRAEMEMELALTAAQPEAALLHLELARIHRERRDAVAMLWREAANGERPPITRTDKEA
jgi:hypothetical protein